MTPHLRHAAIETTIGTLDVVVDRGSVAPHEGDDVVIGVYFPGHWTRPDPGLWGPRVGPDAPIFAQTRTQLEELFAGTRTHVTVPIELRGSPFQRAVWDVLLAIPAGQTVTYGEVAGLVGSRNAQLVGQAVGHNPISIIVPCHRVVGANGTLTGYAGGVDRKAWLLELEGALEITDAFLDEDAHRSLLERGWSPGENRATLGDLWEWESSNPGEVDTAGTSIYPAGDGGFRVELVSEWPDPITEVTYPGLPDLLDDIEVLEALRVGDPTPTLPHATNHQTRPRRRFAPDTWT